MPVRPSAAFAVLVACLAGCSSGGRVGSLAPDFAATDAQGEAVSLGAYGGEAVILEFFAVW